MTNVKLLQGDCLELMRDIPDGSVDAVITDPPYGTTACKWDTVIPFEPMWEQLKRIINNNGAIVLFGKHPFTANLVHSNLDMFRYEIIWDKNAGTDFAQVNNKPVNTHENILVFSKDKPVYNRLNVDGFQPYSDKRTRRKRTSTLGAKGLTKRIPFENKTTRSPTTIWRAFPDNRKGNGSSLHPTQKPLELVERLVMSYTNEGDTVLDFTMGSGTTMVACVNTQRHGIGIEILPEYFEIAERRVKEAQMQPTLFEDAK